MAARRVSDTQRRRIELADQELAESSSIQSLMDECRSNFGLAAKVLTEIKRGKFQKIDASETMPKAMKLKAETI